ncbi:MAG: aminoacyl-histidine dipeptidase [Bacteroidota bacterium]|nr:aminoacyl-histidine dipeptidase [Bacteroidota bacterium]
MSKDILNLEPKALWADFYALTQIPRPSKKEQKIQDFLYNFGKKLGLETIRDEVGNIIIRKPATPGMENRKGVIIQAHMDMVPQKNSDKVHDFEKDPLEPHIDGEWVKATGTTLGADDGMGVAAAMAILEAKDIHHGPIEALFTTDEETGMTGASGIKGGLLKGDILLNLDSEDEGELYIGCAGGTNATLVFTYKEEPVPQGVAAFKLAVSGMRGGHSGTNINLGRGNANKAITRILWQGARKYGLRLSDIEGGSLRNAIPREAFATVTIPVKEKDNFAKCVQKMADILKNELATVDPDLKVQLTPVDLPGFVMDEKTQNNLIAAIYGCPTGVMRMSDDMPGLVETSNNLAMVKSENGKITVLCLLRSSVDSAKLDLEYMIRNIFELAGAEANFDGQYPGWKPNTDSPILRLMLDIYKKLFGKLPEIKAIHAGLECGLLGGIYPNWDMISFGPTIKFAHSPDEKVNIETVNKFWIFLLETLKNVPNK